MDPALNVGDIIEKAKWNSKLLFKFFSNNLYLGQWQLAQACIQKLKTNDIGTPFSEVIDDVIKYPFNRSIISDSVPSPCHLAWLCLLETDKCNKKPSQTGGGVVHSDCSLIEFHFLLLEACANVPDAVLKELYLYHRWVHSDAGKSHTQTLHLSSNLLRFLQGTLSRQPDLGHALISALSISDGAIPLAKNNRTLQLVYVSCINALIDELTQVDTDDQQKLGAVEKVYEILAVFSPSESSGIPLRQLFSKLLGHCKNEPKYVSKTSVLSVLMGNADHHMLDEFCRIDYESEMNNAVATYQTCANLKEDQRCLLHLSSLTNISDRWKMFYLLSTKNQNHLLEAIMETGLSLIRCSLFEELEQLMAPPELRPLKPLLLLLGWTCCCSSTEAKQLLKTLWSDNRHTDHPAITAGCNKLAYQIDLIQWCMEKTRPLISDELSKEPKYQRAADIFKGLEDHSVLYVLHQSTKLSSLDQLEVVQLLQKVPLQGDTGDSKEKKKKTVRFQVDEQPNSVAENAIPCRSLDQQKDISIYTGYCVLKNVMDAILFCAECSDERLANPIRSRSRHKVSNYHGSESSSETEGALQNLASRADICDKNNCDEKNENLPVDTQNDVQAMYKDNVTEKLTQVKLYLSKLQPLTFRVEILENVFSLLFLTHEDIVDTVIASEYNSEELDDKIHRSASIETPTLTPLLESGSVTEDLGRTIDVPQVTTSDGFSHLAYDIPFDETTISKSVTGEKETDMKEVEQKLERVISKIAENQEQTSKGLFFERRLSSVSENISSVSKCSSCSMACFGFIVNEYLVRDILSLLKDCLLDLSAAKYQLYGNRTDMRERFKPSKGLQESKSYDIDPLNEEPLSHLVKSSVTMETMHKRITQLQKFTSEAQWRFQLVSHDQIPKSVGDVLSKLVVAMGDMSDEEVDIRGLAAQKGHRKRKLSPRHDAENSDHSNTALIKGQRKSRSLSVATRPGQVKARSVISQMLASPVSLLTMSIRKGNFTQTKQIIKLCKLEERAEAVEVYFCQAYQKASRSVTGLTGNISSQSPSLAVPGKPSMLSLASVAAAGMATVSVANISDELLNFPALTPLPLLDKEIPVPHNVAQNLDPENLPVMILLDLVCTAARNWEVCNHLIDAIKTRIPKGMKQASEVSKSPDPKLQTKTIKPKSTKIKLFSDILSHIEGLLHLGVEEQFSRQEQAVLTKSFQKSIQHYFCQGVYPLTSQKCKEFATLCQTVAHHVDKVQEALRRQKKRGRTNSESPVKSEMRQRLGSAGSVSSLSGSLKDKPVLHHCMKQLIRTVENGVPPGGLVNMMSRKQEVQPYKNKNYLLSLYEHCKELAYLVSESESKTKETRVIPENYFVMLEEGPIRILGSMMFNKKMQPERLEKVAEKLSLNLTHIIVYSCCVKIPSKRLPALRPVMGKLASKLHDGKVIHNYTQQQTDTPGVELTNYEEFLRSLLSQLVSLMKDFGSQCNAEGLFDSTSAELMMETADYHNIIVQLHVLQFADLSKLDKSQRRCFYGNLQTIMTIHCFMNHLQGLKKQDSSSERDVGPRLPWKHYSEMSVTEQITWLNTFSYRVGQLGVISLLEVKYIINRCGLPPPSEWGLMLEHRLMALDETDPWVRLAPTPDPQLLFAMTTCCSSSPPVQVLEPSSVKVKLESSMREFLQHTVEVNTEQKLVKVPELLLWNRRDFINELNFLEHTGENEGLLHFIASQLSDDKERDLKGMLSSEEDTEQSNITDPKAKIDLPFDIEVVPYSKDFLCVFEFKSLNQSAILQTSLGSSPSVKSYSGDSTLSYDMPYNLTANTLEYIKSDCPLVATLVSLVCSDQFDEMESELHEDYFNVSLSPPADGINSRWSLRNRSPSAMSLVDIKSYRYGKLTYEYPTLKRHLLNFIVPLAAIEDPDIIKGEDTILKFLTSDTIDKYKSNMLSLHESASFKLLLTDLLHESFSLRKWANVLKIINSVPVTTLGQETSLQNLHDFVLCCLVHTTCSKSEKQLPKEKSEDVFTWIHQLICAETKARELLTVHRKLEIDHNMGLFQMCLCDNRLGEAMTAAVQHKYDEIKIYYRITECAKNLQIKLAMKHSELVSEEDKLASKKRHLILDQFTDWCTVVEWTHTAPREVLGLLIKAGDFETAKSWCKQQKLDRAIQLEIDENHLVSLLSAQPPNTTRAFMILEQLKTEDAPTCLSMCRKFVDIFNRQRDVVFIASYMLNQLSGQLGLDDKDQLRLTHIGARIMLCLPESLHSEYSHLVTTPRYLLEQLIMNMKPDLAGKAFLSVKDEYGLILSPRLQFSAEQFNTLVAMYAKKALEFTVVQSLDLAEKERMFAKNSGSSQDGDNVRSSPHHKMDQSKSSPQPKSLLDSMQVKRRSNEPLGPSRASQGSSTGKISPHPRASSGAEKFVMPNEPPSRDQWVADSAATTCMVCKVERFSMFNRRHHCRRCGRVVCAACSEKTTQIRGVSTRTCDDCYREIVKTSPGDRRTSVEDLYQHQRLSGASLHSQQFTPDFKSTIPEEHPLSLSEVISHNRAAWKLQVDDQYNSQLREDFYFDQAPSTSLCISILDLHGNPKECGRLILKLCDDLSSLLKPIAPGVPNPEVDYSLIMSMTKYLLFHAKMKFMRCGDHKGLGQCDIYQGLVDLLGLLVVANYRDLPSIQELTKMDSVQRLRDKLIEDERLPLAMEVSTKCGLDPAGVWVAMGIICLRSGDFSGAREKFSKCLRVPKDRNVCAPMSKLLNDIIRSLETMPGTGAMEIQLLLANPGSVKNLILTPSAFPEEASLDCQQFQECVYYLKTYASYLSVVDFYRQHCYYMKAVQYVLDHKCSVEVYIEGLLKPSLESGELGRLTDQLLMIDPSLEKWNTYLTSGCRYLVKNKLHHVLYSHQLFMKDYIRAGMTCFNYFYQDGAQSYLDLARRIQFLFTAQQHMQAYLDPAQWGNIQHPLTLPQGRLTWERQDSKGDTTSVRLVKGPEEVKRYIKTIALQIEVTKFLQACLTSGTGEATSIATGLVDSSKLPTLFAAANVRTELAVVVLLSGEDIQNAFGLATRIIKEYKLGAIGIYTHAAREMAKNHRYGNMRQLLDCVEKSGMGSDDVWDEIVGACLLVVADTPSEAKEADNIIKLLRKDPNKINACILCGKLRSAYLISVKENREEDVKRILSVAKRMKQTGVINICNKWLEQYQQARKPDRKR